MLVRKTHISIVKHVSVMMGTLTMVLAIAAHVRKVAQFAQQVSCGTASNAQLVSTCSLIALKSVSRYVPQATLPRTRNVLAPPAQSTMSLTSSSQLGLGVKSLFRLVLKRTCLHIN